MSTEELNKQNGVTEQDAVVIDNTNGVEIKTTKKRKGRGVNNDIATARKKFNEKTDANPSNGLFLGHLENVEVTWSTLKEDAKLPSFAGLAVPRIVFTFASNHTNPTDKKYNVHSFMPVESTVETIPGGKKAWLVDNIFAFMKHVLDVFYLKGRAMTDEEVDLLTLPFEDFDDNLQFVPLEPEEIINGYKTVFENYVKFINNDGKPFYKDSKGNYLTIWMKLLRFTKQKGEWVAINNNVNSSTYGDLGFPQFFGDGCIELFKDANTIPSLSVNVGKESIIFKEVQPKSKTPNAGIPGMPVMPAMGGGMNMGANNSPMYGQSAAGMNDTNAGAPASDLPF